MKPRSEGGVVDPRLNVYGTQRLKVAGTSFDAPRGNLTEQCAPLDCSIIPGNVGANTYNTAIAIGEKAAVLVAEDLGIRAHDVG